MQDLGENSCSYSSLLQVKRYIEQVSILSSQLRSEVSLFYAINLEEMKRDIFLVCLILECVRSQ